MLWLMAVVAFFGYAKVAASEAPPILSNISLVTDFEVVNMTVVMMVLAFLSLTLKGDTNRLTNIIGGSVIGLGTLIALIDGVTVSIYGRYNLMMGTVVVFILAIVWFSYKTPKFQP